MIFKDKKVSVIVAHPDDETIGCGGLIHKMVNNNCEVKVILSLKSNGDRSLKNWRRYLSSFKNACQILGAEPVIISPLVYEHEAEKEIWNVITKVRKYVEWADIILTHNPGDLHYSHQFISKIVEISTRPFRTHKDVLMFEIPTSTDQGYVTDFSPNLFVKLSEEDIQNKCKAFECYKEEYSNERSPEYLMLHSRQRGGRIGEDYAEVFKIARMFS